MSGDPKPFKWLRTQSLGRRGATALEEWTITYGDSRKTFPVRARFGKEITLARIKQKHSFQSELDGVEEKRKFFDDRGDFTHVDSCPVCFSAREAHARPIVKIWQGTYVQCDICSHVFTDLRPSDSVLAAYYERGTLGKEYYLQTDEIELRIEQLYAPKLSWLVDSFRSQFGRDPRSIVDIGAGSGHFLFAAKRSGLEVAGLEIDTIYQNFSQEHFGIRLVNSHEELRKDRSGGYDIVTSFNVIEHVTQPGDLLATYRALANEESLVAVETPHFDSLTVWLQRHFSHRIRGYLSPYEHVQMFTQGSLATTLLRGGFAVSDCWIFGQDVRELIFQLSVESGHDLRGFLELNFNAVQEGVDRAHLGDLMLLAAVPTDFRC